MVSRQQPPTLLERIRVQRERNALKNRLFPIQSDPYSSLHRRGELPFWMRSTGKGALPGNRNVDLPGDAVARILHDSGQDLWLFLSRRGLEIRSFYTVPRSLANPRLRPNHFGLTPFSSQIELLHQDVVDWDDLAPEANLSAHERIRRAKLLAGLEEVAAREKSVARAMPHVFLQARRSTLIINMDVTRFKIARMEGVATEISVMTGQNNLICGYRYLGAAALSAAARRLSSLHQGLPPWRRLMLLCERAAAGHARPAAFPARTWD